MLRALSNTCMLKFSTKTQNLDIFKIISKFPYFFQFWNFMKSTKFQFFRDTQFYNSDWKCSHWSQIYKCRFYQFVRILNGIHHVTDTFLIWVVTWEKYFRRTKKNIFDQKIFSSKKCRPKNIFEEKKFRPKTFWSKKIFSRKKFRPKNIFEQKISSKIFSSRQISTKNIFEQTNFDQKHFRAKKISTKNIFDKKKFDQKKSAKYLRSFELRSRNPFEIWAEHGRRANKEKVVIWHLPSP